MVLTTRRVAGLVVLVLVVLIAVTAWQLWRVQRDLAEAQRQANVLISSFRSGDPTERDAALGDFRTATAAAHDHTDNIWWGVMSHLPLVGDDAEGIQVLAKVLDQVAEDGVQPMVESVADLDDLTSDGRVDLAKVTALQAPVAQAHSTFSSANNEVGSLDSSGYAGVLKSRCVKFADQLSEATDALAAADTAMKVLPSFLGADEPRRYLLVFQNNAEIRATGGIPGSWAEVTTDDGKMSIKRQGTGSSLSSTPDGRLAISTDEQAVYTDVFGIFFQDATFTPDFPRAAELMEEHWEATFPEKLDGVLSLDPVALSYMLAGTGPVKVEGVTLTSDNAVEQLLNAPYLRFPDPDDQDAFFAAAAKAIFDKTTDDLRSPIQLARGLVRAADEGRFLAAPFTEPEKTMLADSQVVGAVPEDDGAHPHTIVTLNDGTGAKMSYYLRYSAAVTPGTCMGDRQTLNGSMTLDQTVPKAEAASLPEYITGGGTFGTEPGTQTVYVRLYGPVGGDISAITLNGTSITSVAPVYRLDGRPVVVLAPTIEGPDDVVINWTMTTGAGQTGDGTVDVTPSVVAGTKDSTFASAC